MIEKYCNFEVTAMEILVKNNQRYYDNCELLDCKMVGLGGLEPPTSPLSGVRSNQAELQTHKNGNVHSTFRIQFGQLFFKDF